jgi:hypothetical protein
MSAARKMIDEYLGRLGSKLGLDGLSLDDRGHCGLVLAEERLQLNLELLEGQDLVAFHADLGNVRERERLAIYERLLRGNLYGLETRGAALALDPERREIVLCATRRVAELTHYGLFERLVEDLLEVASVWAVALDRAVI